MMGKLVAIKAPAEIPCQMHNCYNPIAYKLVHTNYVDIMGMEVAEICEECAQSLLGSLLEDNHPEPVDVDEQVDATPKRGRPRKNDMRDVRV